MGPAKTGEKQDRERDSNGRFVKGVSGNPSGGGRPKKPKCMKETADQMYVMLVKMASDPNTNDKLRADIAVKIYEWQYGKATQKIAGDAEESAIKIEMPAAIKELSE